MPETSTISCFSFPVASRAFFTDFRIPKFPQPGHQEFSTPVSNRSTMPASPPPRPRIDVHEGVREVLVGQYDRRHLELLRSLHRVPCEVEGLLGGSGLDRLFLEGRRDQTRRRFRGVGDREPARRGPAPSRCAPTAPTLVYYNSPILQEFFS